MKPTMLSRERATYLFDHVLDGFESSHKGIEQLKKNNLIGDQEYTELLEKNTKRLIDRVKEFKIVQRLVCLVFACMFTVIQVNGDDLEMRRSSRTRTRTSTSRRDGRRKEVNTF